MATFTSHVLDAVSGQSVVGIRFTGSRLRSSGVPEALFDVRADDEGRISVPLDLSAADPGDRYEIVIHHGEHFADQALPATRQVMREIVLRIEMPDADRRYHIPLIVSPHSYSTWWSA